MAVNRVYDKTDVVLARVAYGFVAIFCLCIALASLLKARSFYAWERRVTDAVFRSHPDYKSRRWRLHFRFMTSIRFMLFFVATCYFVAAALGITRPS